MVSDGFDRDADDASGRETTFAMDPQTVIWGLARQLVQGQSDLAEFRRAADAAIRTSASKGYLDGAAMAEMFAWLRPTDLVWRYWVNNYIQGKSPAPFDVLFWNADTTRMAANLHKDMVTMGLNNTLVTPGEQMMMGTPVDLSKVECDAYVLGGISDHICPWQATERSAALLGSKDNTYVLSTAGHIAALVNPPGNPKSSFRTGPVLQDQTPEEWFEAAEKQAGSWWPHHLAWLNERDSRPRLARAMQSNTAAYAAQEGVAAQAEVGIRAMRAGLQALDVVLVVAHGDGFVIFEEVTRAHHDALALDDTGHAVRGNEVDLLVREVTVAVPAGGFHHGVGQRMEVVLFHGGGDVQHVGGVELRIVGQHVGDALPVDAQQHVAGAHACALGRAARLHGLDGRGKKLFLKILGCRHVSPRSEAERRPRENRIV